MVKTGEWLEKPSDIPRHMSATLTANMFPPDPTIGEGLHLERWYVGKSVVLLL